MITLYQLSTRETQQLYLWTMKAQIRATAFDERGIQGPVAES